jgi:tRNA(Ile)-lysidine synthase
MLTEFERKIADFILAERLLKTSEKVLLAVSGGADSTALLYIVVSLKAAGTLPVDICCAHVNHQLRGDEALRDEDFVVGRCSKLGVPVTVERIDVRGYARREKLSIETAARQLRIDALLEIAKRQNCTCVATAHHKNDNAETILHRMIRGTGFRGLCGIWPAKEFAADVRFVRPLLCVTRREIVQYLNDRNLKWCEDRTNEDLAYKRNSIRHRLLPALQKDCKERLIDELFELAKASRGFYRLICRSADVIWPDVATIDKQTVTLDSVRLNTQPPEVKIEVIRRAVALLGCGEQDFTEQHYENILKLSDNATVQLPESIEAHRQGGKITFILCRTRGDRGKEYIINSADVVALKVPGKAQFGHYIIEAEIFDYDEARFKKFRTNKNNTVEWFDFDKLNLPLEIRFRRPGDRFRPLGLAGEKKVGKFLTTAKISSSLRRKLFVIADSEKIIWLCPVRLSERVKVTEQTKRILQLKVGS